MLSGASLFSLGRTIDAVVGVDPDELAQSLMLYTSERQSEVISLMLEMGEPSNSPFVGPISGSMRADGNGKVGLTCEIVDTNLNLSTQSDVLLGIRPAPGSPIDDLSAMLTGHPNRALFVMFWSFKVTGIDSFNDANDTVLPFIAHVNGEACKTAGVSEYVVARTLLANAFFGIHRA